MRGFGPCHLFCWAVMCQDEEIIFTSAATDAGRDGTFQAVTRAARLILLLAALKCKRPPGRRFLNTFNAASATLALGSIAAGVVSIYGSTNVLVKVYPIAGALMLLTALYFFITENREKPQ